MPKNSKEKRMSLGVVTPQLSSYGGSEIYLLECLKRWQKTVDITLYTPSFEKSLFEEFKIGSRVNVMPLPSDRPDDSRVSLLYETLVLPRIWELHIRRHDLYFLYLFPTQMIQRRPSVWFAAEPLRMLYDLRHYSNDKERQASVHLYPRYDYTKIRVSDLEVTLQTIENADSRVSFDRLVTNSYSNGQYLENIYGRKPDRVAYPGITRSGKFSPPSSFNKVLYVGRLWRHKRVELIIKAMALTRSANQLIIAGDGPEKPRLMELAERCGIKENVLFTGDVSMEERDRLFQESTCCVYTPVREPFGMVPLEAAAAGRPVVATDGGGYSEILTGDAVFLVPPYEGAIADAIHKLMSNPELAVKMGSAGKKIVEAYTWDRTADTLMDVFRETVNGPVGRKYGRRDKTTGGHRPQLGVHYHTWYRAGKNQTHWNENPEFAGVTDFPAGGPYSSHHLSLIRRHLRLAGQAGIDFFVINLQVDFRGLNQGEMEAAEKLFTVVEQTKHPIKLAILLAINAEDPDVLKGAVRQVRDRFLWRLPYQRYDEKAVLWYFLHDQFQGLLYHHFDDLERLHRDIHTVAAGDIVYNKFLPGLLRRFFSSWCLYSPLTVGPRDTWDIIWRESYRDFVEDGGALRTFTVCPGWDDSHLTSDGREACPFRRIPRMGVKTYECMQKAALSLRPRPDYVVVTSFNEFHENTHIEPSEKFGKRYLQSTAAFKEKLIGHY